jgi:hypothetical protein
MIYESPIALGHFIPISKSQRIMVRPQYDIVSAGIAHLLCRNAHGYRLRENHYIYSIYNFLIGRKLRIVFIWSNSAGSSI